MDENWNESARSGTATNIVIHRKRTRGIAEEKVTGSLVEPFSGQDVEERSEAGEKVKPRERRQKGRSI